MNFVLGFNLNVLDKRNSIFNRFIVPVFGFLIIVSHLAVNGPCGLFSYKKRHDVSKHLEAENPFEILPEDQQGKILLVKDVCRMAFFFATPLIHFFFLINVLFTNIWNDLGKCLNIIQQKMKLSDIFYCKCRRQCFVALAILVLVIQNLEIHKYIKFIVNSS